MFPSKTDHQWIQIMEYLGLGTPAVPLVPVHVSCPHKPLLKHCCLLSFSALAALLATLLASDSTITKSGSPLLIMVSCFIALSTPTVRS